MGHRNREGSDEETLSILTQPIEAGEIAIKRSHKARDAAGRRLRQDGAALLATVISYPVEWAALQADADTMTCYCAWRADTLGWLKAEYGTALESVVEHTDDRFPHLHAFAVPELGCAESRN
jgi:hypothetical protein